jgi:hypothetical protein
MRWAVWLTVSGWHGAAGRTGSATCASSSAGEALADTCSGCLRPTPTNPDRPSAIPTNPDTATGKYCNLNFDAAAGNWSARLDRVDLLLGKNTQAALHLIQGEKPVLLNAIFCIAEDWLRGHAG